MGRDLKTVLLDTNAWTMALTLDNRLSPNARKAIEKADVISVSSISLYEIGQKVRLGKWPEMESLAHDLVEIATTDNYTLLAVTPQIGLDASLLNWGHRDPFDRFIAATAMAEGLPLVSSDTAFDALEGVTRIWN